MAVEQFKIQKQLLRAQFQPNTFNEKERTVDVIFATETMDVERYDYMNGNYFIEQLICTPETVDLSRINAGAPFLDNHISWGSVRQTLGKVVENSARFIGNKIGCTVQFSGRTDVAPVMQDVKDGILTNISMGYDVQIFERQAYIDGETPVYKAIRWTPIEVTLVIIPADIDAGVNRSKEELAADEKTARVRNIDVVEAKEIGAGTGTRSTEPPKNSPNRNNPNPENMELTPLQLRAKAVGLPITATEADIAAEERKMALIRKAILLGLPNTATEAEVETAERAAKEKSDKSAAEKATTEEHTRTTEITKMVRTHKLPVEFSDKLIADKTSLDNARKLVMDELAKGTPQINGQVTITGDDEQQKMRKGIAASLIMRSGAIPTAKLEKDEVELAGKFRNLTLLDLSKDALKRAAIDYSGMDKMEIALRALTSHSSDFPVLLAGTNRRVLLMAYATAPDKWSTFCKKGSVSDFRVWQRLRPGSIARLDPLLEGEEYRAKKMPDAVSAGVSVDTFGNFITLTRQMIINDDLGGFLDSAANLGRAGKRSIEVDVFAYLTQNGGQGPLMADGQYLFSAAHANFINAVAVPSMATYDSIRQTFAKQQDAEKNEYLDLEAAILITPVELKGLADSINKSLFDPDAANKLQKPNIVQNMFTNVVGTPRLASPGYYAFADPAVMPTIEVTFLDGVEEPYMESHIPFKQDGIQWKVRMDYGVDAVETKGGIFIKNA